MLVKLVVGDWSNDGHGNTRDIVYEVNTTARQMDQAHEQGAKAIGVAWEKVCEDYQDHTVPDDVMAKLKKHGIELPDECIGPDEFAWVWLEIAKIGDPSLDCQEVYLSNHNIGGYGLIG